MFASTKTSNPGGYQISRSLRFRASASAYISRTPGSAGNRRTFTWSGWVKRGILGVSHTLFTAGTNSSNNFRMAFNTSNQLVVENEVSAVVTQYRVTTAVYRDPSAWYHVVLSVDTTQATAANRVKLYVNGSEVTVFTTNNNPTQNFDLPVNNTVEHRTSASFTPTYADWYLTEINLVDGQALAASDFGYTDIPTGVWVPKKYAGTYGTNGYYLNFSDNSGTTSTTIGKDSSGNGNNWTPTNISVTSGVTYDSMVDTPTSYADGENGRGNYVTVSPFDGATEQLVSGGGLNLGKSGNGWNMRRVGFYPSTGKWYWEFTGISVSSSDLFMFGLAGASEPTGNYLGVSGSAAVAGVQIAPNNTAFANLYGSTRISTTVTWSLGGFSAGAIVMVAYDADNNRMWLGMNGTWANSGAPASGTGWLFNGLTNGLSPAYSICNASESMSVNFGQRPFSYTPPSGFKALNTQNLPSPTITRPSNYFDVKLDTGANIKATAEATFSGDDLVWIKDRANSNNHQLIDTIRGSSAVLQSNSTSAETTYSAPSGNSVAWVWSEGATPGFDIVTYTGNGANRTISHSLGVAPSMMIVKQRTAASSTNWAVWHKSLANTEYLLLNSTAAKATGATYWNSTSPTSSVFSLGTAADVNTNSGTYVNYLFSEVEGFSKIGSFIGNGSADGPFVYCGFRPKFIIAKYTGADDWVILDSAREPQNVLDLYVNPNLASAEQSYALADFTSNGFKLRNTATWNTNGGTTIYMAFAENPFKYSLAR